MAGVVSANDVVLVALAKRPSSMAGPAGAGAFLKQAGPKSLR